MHILHAKGVSDVTKCASDFILKHVIVVGEGSSRLDVLLRGFPFSYVICFSQQEGSRT